MITFKLKIVARIRCKIALFIFGMVLDLIFFRCNLGSQEAFKIGLNRFKFNEHMHLRSKIHANTIFFPYILWIPYITKNFLTNFELILFIQKFFFVFILLMGRIFLVQPIFHKNR